MPSIWPRTALSRRRIGLGGVALLTVWMWYAGSAQFTRGVLDLAVFAPPGAALGLATVWSAHAFAPSHFTWRRGLYGAVGGGIVVSPLVAFLVAFAAAWEPVSFQFVFNLGAWLALAAGLGVGGVGWVFRWFRAWRRPRPPLTRAAASLTALDAAMPDARDGVRPTAHRQASPYSAAPAH